MQDTQYDVIVVGSGAGALLGAVRAADQGLKPLVIEKAPLIGGTSATSGGGIWIPCNDGQAAAGVQDSLDDAFRYVKGSAGGLSSDARILAYVETARVMARYLGEIGVAYRCMPLYADYYPHLPGARPGGRTMDPADFDAGRLGLEALETMRPTCPGQLILGKAHINAFEAHTLMTKRPGANWVLAKMLGRYFLDLRWRRRTRRDRRLTGGQALIGGLLHALHQRQVPVWRSTALQSLIVEDGPTGRRVAGVVAERDGQVLRLSARKAVLLGAGGFERNAQMRAQYLPQPSDAQWTATPPAGNTGDAIRAGAEAGGALHLMAWTWGAPTLDVPREEKFRALFVERNMPGCMVVNARGERFLDESCPYPEFQQAMFANHAATGGAIPAWIVFDATFRAKYPMGPLMPASAVPDAKLRKRWWNELVWKGDTLRALAAQIGVDADGLQRSAARMSEFARSGVDADFGRGGNAFDRYYSDSTVGPNPNLAPIEKGPFYAMRLWPGDIGTKGGLLTDADARVLDAQGQVIAGLYCVGNNSASVMGAAYPGAGSTLGPAMTFAFRAVADIAGAPIPLQRTDLIGLPVPAGERASWRATAGA
ncbi:MAG TPA: FAD-binding protein [Burkholderiaceae bacterium]|nr:FAD-binding protein [Burkholderiaceae bacterium]HNG80259.1 FAD-binding protein [Burkholderiaceae bacterium]